MIHIQKIIDDRTSLVFDELTADNPFFEPVKRRAKEVAEALSTAEKLRDNLEIYLHDDPNIFRTGQIVALAAEFDKAVLRGNQIEKALLDIVDQYQQAEADSINRQAVPSRDDSADALGASRFTGFVIEYGAAMFWCEKVSHLAQVISDLRDRRTRVRGSSWASPDAYIRIYRADADARLIGDFVESIDLDEVAHKLTY